VTVTVAIPVLNGGALLGEVLAAVREQEIDRPVELLVIDSGSRDGSRELARRHGAHVVEIPRADFSHGGTRNRLMELSRGEHVAFLTQDSVPAGPGWLAALVGGFGLTDDVALVCGPYLPRPGDSPMVRRELTEFFARFGAARVDRGADGPGPATFFSSANGAVARWAWKRVPFRPVAYAEDQLLARDMLAAGLAKAYVPEAAVLHSHDFPPAQALRRYFDDFRALAEVYGHREPLTPRYIAARIRGDVRADRAFMRSEGGDVETLRSLRHNTARALGRSLGANAERLPAWARRMLSHDGRATFEPVPPPPGAHETPGAPAVDRAAAR
jgi:glycosyltransferase involved in cell wall biosynthesis